MAPAEPPSDRSLVGGLRRLGFFGSSDFVASEFHGGKGSSEVPPHPIPESLAAGWEGPPTFGRFELLQELGRGGMGVVYRARDMDADRELALKIVLRSSGESTRLARFAREGQVTASLVHPGIVRVHSAGDVDGLPFLAYELVEDARTLGDAFAGADRRKRVQYVMQAARALGFAHAKGVVHRDVKPDNLLVGRDDRVRVVDFGLALATDVDRITQSGDFMGTPLFMSPEQFAGKSKNLGPQSDVWALGVILYQALTDEVPFDGATLIQLGLKVTQADPVRPRALDKTVSPALEAVCLRALHPEVELRYSNGEAMADDLRQALAGGPVSGSGESTLRRLIRRRGLPLFAGGVLTLSGLVGLAVWSLPGERAVVVPAREGPRERVFELTSPAEGAAVEELSTRVEGSAVRGTVLVRVRINGEEPISLRPLEFGAFGASVALRPGSNQLDVRCEGASGEVLGLKSRTIECQLGADWYRRLSPEERAPFPLPAGLGFAGEGEYVNSMDGSVLVWIPPGRFRMGNDEGTLEERPEHRVTFSRGFFLGKFELTWGKFQRFWLATRGEQLAPRGFEGDGPPSSLVDEQPVHGVGFPVAMEYAKWAGLRLPLEAEWEYAARGPKWLPYPWGREPLAATRANVGVLPDDSADAYPFTSPVGSFPAGRAPFGCLDMVGNVREWTVISGLGYPPAATEVVDPKPAEALAPLPSQRGGSYFDGVGNATPTSRVMLGVIAAEVEIDVGIRVARSAD